MHDYWLSKLFFDLQAPGAGARWRESREEFLKDYKLPPELRKAVLEDDVRTLAPNVNAYLLRFYLAVCGYDDPTAMKMLHSLKEPAHG